MGTLCSPFQRRLVCTLDLHARMGSQTWAQGATLKWPASPQQCTQHTLGKLPRASLMVRALMEHGRGFCGTVNTVLNDTRLFAMSWLTLFSSYTINILYFCSPVPSPQLSSFSSENSAKQTKQTKKESLLQMPGSNPVQPGST